MSLELAIQENTAVLRELVQILQTPPHVDNFPVQPAVEPQEIPAQLKKTKPAPKQSSDLTPPASETLESSSTESSAAKEQPAATFDDAKKALRALYDEKGRDVTVEALSRFGAAKVTDLLPEHYGLFAALCNEVLAGGEA